MRQFQFRVGHENFALIHVSLVPDMHGEQKTKPTQTTVHALRGLGLLPDLVCHFDRVANPLFTRLSVPDCMPFDCAKATGARNKSENLHVLSRRNGTGHRRA